MNFELLHYRVKPARRWHGNTFIINGLELQAHIEAYSSAGTWLLTKRPKIHIGEKIPSSTNGAVYLNSY